MKFVIIVEGPTESEIIPALLKKWLDPRLKDSVGIQAVNRKGAPNLIKRLHEDVVSYLTDKKHGGDVIGVIGLADIYELPIEFPKSKSKALEKVKWAKEELEKRVDNSRFRMFFAVHELEAWLLSDIGIFSQGIKKRLLKYTKYPEKINSKEPPAKLLHRVYYEENRKKYNKPVIGKQLFKNLNPEIAAEKCPNLKKLLIEMLTMAKSAVQ